MNNIRNLPKGIFKRADGRYEYKKYMNGYRKSYYAKTLEEIIGIKEKYENELVRDDLKQIKNIKESVEYMKNDNWQYVYFISDGEFCKIGVASNIEQRLKQLQTGNAKELKVIRSIKTKILTN